MPTEKVTPVEPTIPVTPKKSNKTLLIIIIVVLLLACCACGIGGYVLYKYGKVNFSGDINVGVTPSPTAAEGEDTPTGLPTGSDDEDEVKFTSEFEGSNAEWAPTLIKVTSPIALEFEYPTEWGTDPLMFADKNNDSSCTTHEGDPTLEISFDEDVDFFINTCVDNTLPTAPIKSYSVTSADGHIINVKVYDDAIGYQIRASDKDQDIVIEAEIDGGATYEDDLNQIDLFLKSIDLK